MSKMFQLLLIIIGLAISVFYPLKVMADSQETANFLSLSDIHFDPFINCQSKKPCPVIQALNKAPASAWPAILANDVNDVPQYRQDTTYPLLQSALSAAKKAAEKQDAQFVLILGDYLGHDYRKFYKKYSGDEKGRGYHEFVKKTYQFLNAEIGKAFPNIDVFQLVGNNDSYRGDYVSEPGGRFYSDLANLWSNLIKQPANRSAMQSQFPKAGYYAVGVPGQPKLRLILLNSVLFSSHARGRGVTAAANEELNWLHRQLADARQKHQKVFIAMHIPVGIDVYASLKIKLFTLLELWQPQYSKRFHEELSEYAPEISAIFSGHLHSDWFQVMTLNGREIPVTGTPAISPLFGNNPGFKIYTYNINNLDLKDYITYYYPLSGSRIWTVEYDFNKIYQSHCKNCVALDGMNLLQRTGEFSNYYKNYYSLGTNSQPITTEWNPYYWCAIHQTDADAYLKCVG